MSDIKGNLIVYSLKDKREKAKFNFIKRDLKFDKNLNISTNDDNIYVSDNLGFLYAYNYEKNKFCGQKTIRYLLDQI